MVDTRILITFHGIFTVWRVFSMGAKTQGNDLTPFDSVTWVALLAMQFR